MKLAFVTSKHSDLNPVPLVAKHVSKKVAGIHVVQKTADTNLDIPYIISGLKGFDLVVVVLYFHEETLDVKVAMEKLVDLDLKGQKSIKFIERSHDQSERDEAKRIYRAVMDSLFGGMPKKKPPK